MGITRSNCFLSTGILLGIILTLCGTCLVIYWPRIFDSTLDSHLVLTEDSVTFEPWRVTPIPLYTEFYFFNWTNKDDFLKRGTKPTFKEIGPYVFRQERRKVIQAWNPDNGTITFRQNNTWFFEASLTNGSLDDFVTTLNVPAAATTYICRDCNYLTKLLLNQALSALGTHYHVTKTVREFVFDGYSDPILDLAKLIPKALLPVSIPFDKFGWFYTRNGSTDYDGVFNMKTGAEDITQFGAIANWNYNNRSSSFEPPCGYVRGSAGDFFPPNRDKTSISLFIPDFCRPLTLNYNTEVDVDGINAYHYVGDGSMFPNPTLPEDRCMCTKGQCPPFGVLDISACKWGAPAFVSFPHYYLADPSYRNAVVGMKPDKKKHEMFLDLEPRSGLPLQVTATFQLNILVQPLKEFKLFRDAPKIYFPLAWFKQSAKINAPIMSELQLLSKVPLIGEVLFFILLSAGVTFVFVSGLFYLRNKCVKGADDQDLLVD